MSKIFQYKGTVLEKTLSRLLADIEWEDKDYNAGGITYWNGRHTFLAKKKSVRYWDIFLVRG